MKQMTALEWLEQEIDLHLHDSLAHAGIDLHMYIKQAKLIEKQQIIDAWDDGYREFYDGSSNPEVYYNETFKSE